MSPISYPKASRDMMAEDGAKAAAPPGATGDTTDLLATGCKTSPFESMNPSLLNQWCLRYSFLQAWPNK